MPATECEILRQLRSEPALFARIAEFEGDELALQRELRKDYDGELVRAALTLTELRVRAAEKFSRADRLWFDRRGLEQATAEAIARHKAERFRDVPKVWDLCCGIGGDAIAFARHTAVEAADLNPAAILRTTWNAEEYGVADRVATRLADVTELISQGTVDGACVHLDPDRRAATAHRRSVRIEDYVPSPDAWQSLFDRAAGGAIKVSPAANFVGRFPDAEAELISLRGECKEATLWFGDLAQPGLWSATVLPAVATFSGNPLAGYAPITTVARYVYDPDPAIVRAGLVSCLAEKLGITRLDEEEEYLTSEVPVETPFARRYEVRAVLPKNEKALRKHFREANYGAVEIKHRRIPVDGDAMRSRLQLSGAGLASVIVARVAGKAKTIVCRRDESA